jgi:hypothetical protein
VAATFFASVVIERLSRFHRWSINRVADALEHTPAIPGETAAVIHHSSPPSRLRDTTFARNQVL